MLDQVGQRPSSEVTGTASPLQAAPYQQGIVDATDDLDVVVVVVAVTQ